MKTWPGWLNCLGSNLEVETRRQRRDLGGTKEFRHVWEKKGPQYSKVERGGCGPPKRRKIGNRGPSEASRTAIKGKVKKGKGSGVSLEET